MDAPFIAFRSTRNITLSVGFSSPALHFRLSFPSLYRSHPQRAEGPAIDIQRCSEALVPVRCRTCHPGRQAAGWSAHPVYARSVSVETLLLDAPVLSLTTLQVVLQSLSSSCPHCVWVDDRVPTCSKGRGPSPCRPPVRGCLCTASGDHQRRQRSNHFQVRTTHVARQTANCVLKAMPL